MITVTITGPVKCGKTTILRIITGALLDAGCDVDITCDTKIKEVIKKPNKFSGRVKIVEKVDFLYNR